MQVERQAFPLMSRSRNEFGVNGNKRGSLPNKAWQNLVLLFSLYLIKDFSLSFYFKWYHLYLSLHEGPLPSGKKALENHDTGRRSSSPSIVVLSWGATGLSLSWGWSKSFNWKELIFPEEARERTTCTFNMIHLRLKNIHTCDTSLQVAFSIIEGGLWMWVMN